MYGASCGYFLTNLPWASYQIRKIAGCACAGNAGNIFPRRRFQSKSLVSDPGMHHGTCVTHVPWCMSGSLIRSDGENVPGIPGACAPAILRIWQEAHGMMWPHYITFSSNLGPPQNRASERILQSLRWRHNDHAGVSNHQPHGCLLNRLFWHWSKKTSKLRVTGLCAGNSP